MTPSRPTNQKAARSARLKAWNFRPNLLKLEDRLAPASYTVNTFADPQLVTIPSADAATAGGGTISLRSAIQQIDVGTADGSLGPDVITLAAGVYRMTQPQDPTFVPSGTTAATIFHDNLGGAFTINPKTASNVEIDGQGAGITFIDAQGLDRIFNIIGKPTDLTVTLSGITLLNGSAGTFQAPSTPLFLETGAGGAVLMNDSGLAVGANQLFLNNCAVQSNAAAEDGGAVFSYTGDIILNGTAVNHNVSAQNGGGVATFLGNVTVASSLMQFNLSAGTSNGGGGAIYIGGDVQGSGVTPRSVIDISASDISSNSTGGAGGALWDANLASPGPQGTLAIRVGSTITSNAAALGGGAVESAEPVITVANSAINSNHAGGDGGGIHNVSSNGNMTLTSATMNGNTAGGSGGAIANGELVFVGTPITGATNVSITGSQFVNNVADGGAGGAIRDVLSTTFNDSGSTYQGNSSHGGFNAAGGGALSLENSAGRYNLDLLQLLANRAGGASAGNGGAINNPAGSSFSLTNSNVNGNIGQAGGGVYTNASSVNFQADVVTNNIATTGNGGGISNGLPGSTNSLRMLNLLVSGNVATGFGGGIYTTATNASIDTITVQFNTAGQNGGGIEFQGSQLTLQNTSAGAGGLASNTILDNMAAKNGGGIGADVAADGATPATVAVQNTNIIGNHAGLNGAGIWFESVFGGGKLSVRNSSLQLGIAGLTGGGVNSNAATNVFLFDTVTQNMATMGGGGLYFASNAGTTNALIQNVSVQNTYLASNYAGGGGDGGAILLRLQGSGAYAQIVNDTMVANTAGKHGGAIASELENDFSSTNVLFVTITGNIAGQGGGIYNDSFTPVGLGNTVLAENFAAPDTPPPFGVYVNHGSNGYALFGHFTDDLVDPFDGGLPGGTVGHNYIDPIATGGADVAGSTLSVANSDFLNPFIDFDIPLKSSYLANPAYNGGPLQPANFFTEALLPPFSGAGANPLSDDAVLNDTVFDFFQATEATPPNVIDQTGKVRPVAANGDVDIGAFEAT